MSIALAALWGLVSCGKPGEEPVPQPGPDDGSEVVNPDDGPDVVEPDDAEPAPVAAPEPYLVTSEIIMQFLLNVTYDERDYSYTHVTDPEYAPYGAPGEADMPPKVPVSWKAPEGDISLTLNVDDGEWAYDIPLSPGTESYELSNLVPDRLYHWMVTRDDTGRKVALGTFKTIGLIHQVYFQPKVRNARDIGGWSTVDGKKVKYRKMYRGGEISSGYLNNEGVKEMLREGILAEIDLRESKDVNSSVSRLGKDIAFFNANFSKGYGGLIREYPAKVANTFKFTVKCLRENKPIFYHCSIGRDRTGTMTALYLGLLGVSESDMSKEYELLFFSPKEWSLNGGKTEFDYSRTKKYAHQYTCNTLWQLGGQALGVADSDLSVTFAQRTEAYLLANGVPQKDIDDFRVLMLE